MTKSKRHAVTVLLSEDHLRKMIDDHLIKEEDIGDRVKVARIVQKLGRRFGLAGQAVARLGRLGEGA